MAAMTASPAPLSNARLQLSTVRRIDAIKCCTAVALQELVIRERAERYNDRLYGASSTGIVCVVCAS